MRVAYVNQRYAIKCVLAISIVLFVVYVKFTPRFVYRVPVSKLTHNPEEERVVESAKKGEVEKLEALEPEIEQVRVVDKENVEKTKFTTVRTLQKLHGFTNRTAGHIKTSDLFAAIPPEHDQPAGKSGESPIQFAYKPTSNKQHIDIFVIPHSHNDPGWLQTFEEYYQESVRGILNNMLDFLGKWRDMRFVEAEISFFELWWSEQTDEDKESLRKIVKNGQLEFVGGAWVMTDEANAHYFNTIMEMFEGHEFLSNNFDGYQPKTQWSIDPFGLSTTIPHLMQLSGIKQGVFNRIHHTIKNAMADQRTFEFIWRQPFAVNSSKNDFLCHIMPYLYFADYQCPDRKVCSRFDFYNRFELITSVNVKEDAADFLEQARLKSQFYRTDTVLFLQGHDFDFTTAGQWERTYFSFKTMADYINNNKDLNATLHIATPSEYFEVMTKKLTTEEYPPIPSMSGDFFPYSESTHHYWTGYFTSRPFYKHMDRELAHYIRSADILFSLANWKYTKESEKNKFSTAIYDLLVEARRYHGLFQHHDAITGTARAAVVQDYGQKLEKALFDCKTVIEESLHYLTESNGQKPKLGRIGYPPDRLPQKTHNSEDRLPHRIGYPTDRLFSTFPSVNYTGNDVLSNGKLKVKYDQKSGFLQSIESEGKTTDLRLSFVHYSSRLNPEPRSGAYVFQPANQSRHLDIKENRVVIVKGPVFTELVVTGPSNIKLLHKIRLENNSEDIQIHNELDIRDEHEFEIAMRIESEDLNKKDEQFFTDSNGFQNLRRYRLSNLPLPAQYYPFTTSAYLETREVRLNALTKQPLGIASLKQGQLEIMLERRMSSDDGKGMEQGVEDNKKTESDFVFSLERRNGLNNDEFGRLSARTQHSSQKLLYPPVVGAITGEEAVKIVDVRPLKNDLPCDLHLVALRSLSEATKYVTKKSSVQRKTSPKAKAALILHRFFNEKEDEYCKGAENLTVKLDEIFANTIANSMETSLTGLQQLQENAKHLNFQKMDIKTVVIGY
uniref:mannosyl-oligosaccharide 1,3-1,6-alpha-mannosidase n=1 Tax=Bursaphelenchus xylophilus TaxID=6326 RepID=A0A1I7RJD9_BURXY